MSALKSRVVITMNVSEPRNAQWGQITPGTADICFDIFPRLCFKALLAVCLDPRATAFENLLEGGFCVFAQVPLNSWGCLIQIAKGIRIDRSTMDGLRIVLILTCAEVKVAFLPQCRWW